MSDIEWTGKFSFAADMLDKPLRRKKPTVYFANSMSDLFGEGVSDEQIAAVFGVMAACPQHTFQILTNLAERMREWMEWIADQGRELVSSIGEEPGPRTSAEGSVCIMTLSDHGIDLGDRRATGLYNSTPWPLPNVWLGVSVENQKYADERIPHLLATPAAVRFLSLEPMLGAVDLARYIDPLEAETCINCGWSGAKFIRKDDFEWSSHGDLMCPECGYCCGASSMPGGIDWVICGGESGHGARPMHPEWARSLRDQCADAGVPFFFKQWGEWAPQCNNPHQPHEYMFLNVDGSTDNGWNVKTNSGWSGMGRVGKRAAGRLLDGRTHDGLPRGHEDLFARITAGSKRNLEVST